MSPAAERSPSVPLRGNLGGLTRDQKLALVARLARRQRSEPRAYPLSFAQQRLWFLDRFDPGSHVHNVFRAIELEGPLDRAAFARAVEEMIRRHATLRTGFCEIEGEPRQTVLPATEAGDLLRRALTTVDLRALPPAESRRQLLALARREPRRPFDLTRAPHLRVALLRTGDRHHTLFVTLHHVAADGWSLGILFRELGLLYGSFRAGERSTLAALPIHYSDFARWQREELRLEPQLEYWRQQLAGAPGILELPTDRLRPTVASGRGAVHPFRLPRKLYDRLRALAQQASATPFMLLLAALDALLYRFTGQDDFLVGTPIANRHRAEVEGLIGCFANTLVLRARLDRQMTFRQLLQRVRQHALGAYAHQDLPFERLVEELQPQRDPSRNPLFQVMFALQNTPASRLELPGLTPRPLDFERQLSKVDLTLEMSELGDGLSGYFEFNTDLFEAATIDRLTEHLRVLLTALVANPDRPISHQPLLTAAEHRRLVAVWGRGGRQEVETLMIHRSVAAQAAATPDAVAVVEPGVEPASERRLTYRQLDRRADRLARTLGGIGAGPETRVGIAMERSLEAVVAILGTLKAGAAYLPLDPAYPKERLDTMVADAGVGVILTQTALAGRLPETPGCLKIALDRELPDSGESGNTPPPASPGNVAWVIYTSGSTGRPKGVLTPHRAAAHHAAAIVRRYRLRAADRVLQFASLSFDVAAEELFPTLLSGATLVLRPPALSLTFSDFFRFVERQRLSVLNLPTPYWHEWVSELAGGHLELPPALRLVVVGTEQALPDRLHTWQRVLHDRGAGRRVRWLNAYGPSEATVTATIYQAPALAPAEPAGDRLPTRHELLNHVPIGRPVTNAHAYVLNHYLRPVPVRVPGYLYLGGPGLARGYHGRPALSAEKFVPDPFAGKPGSRIYNTGDVACWLADGNIEFLGRVDQQVKIRGFRIELGEIEAILNRHRAVKETVAVALEAAPGDRRLVVYLVPEGQPAAGTTTAATTAAGTTAAGTTAAGTTVRDITASSRQLVDGVRELALDNMPQYMVPAAFVVLDHLPMTASGKVDRRALPPPSWTAAAHSGPFAAPRTPQQEVLANIFSALLDLPRVAADDNFFDLGGHSLLATRILSRVHQLLGVDLPIRALFEDPTVAGLSDRVDAARRRGSGTLLPPIRPHSPAGKLATGESAGAPPPSFAQQRMWFLDQLEPGSVAYNMPAALRLTGDLEVATLRRALREIVRRQDSLRTTFRATGGRPVQVISPQPEVELPIVEVAGRSLDERLAAVAELAREESLRPFDLARGPLLRTLLLRLDPRRHWLVFTMHHIISDGWSIDVFLRELVRLYDAFRRGEASPLAELPVQVADFARWQRRWLEGEVLDAQLAYWRDQLAGAPDAIELPFDQPRPPVMTFRGARVPIVIGTRLAQRLRALGQRHNVTLFMVYLGAFGVLLHRYSRQDDIVIGTPVAGRQRPELEDLIGLFVNTLVLRLELSGGDSFETLLARVRETALTAYAHQDVPFEQLVDKLRPVRDMSRNPLFQVFFVLHRAHRGGQALEGLELGLPSIDNHTSRFDLTLSLAEGDDGVDGFLEYNTHLFERATAEGLAGHFRTLLEGLSAEPALPVGSIPWLAADERRRLLREWNATRADLPPDLTFDRLFKRQAAKTPNAVAVSCGQQRLTYRQLDDRSDRLARRLRRLGVAPERLVGVCTDRSTALPVALLGVLKAGGAYLPLDPDHPRERLAFMLEDSRAAVLLTQKSLAPNLPEHGARTELLDEPDVLPEGGRRCVSARSPGDAPPVPGNRPRNLAYVIYTSGSTGKPKGVQVSHRALLNFLASMARQPGLTSEDTLLAITTLSFDISGLELLLPLVTGARVALASREVASAGDLLAAAIASSGATVLQATPATWRLLLDAGWPGDPRLEVLCGGEAMPHDLAEQLAARCGALWNVYGPTETTIWSTVHRVGASDATPGTVSIGRPIDNTRVYLLDREMQPVPVAVPGELLIGGSGLARGYLRRPGLTADRFIPDPFAEPSDTTDGRPGGRLYRTGDLARYRADGSLSFLGRIDFQVKIRGFRIELGEIEAALDRHPEVRQAVVVARHDRAPSQPADPHLVAYVVAPELRSTARGSSHLRSFLDAALPSYMVPSAFVFLDQLPLTPNRKVDRRALPAPERDRSALDVAFVAPRTSIEKGLAEIWQEVLSLEEVGVHDSFFELGGHSLLAAQVRARVIETFGVELPLRRLFEAPTVASLAEDLVEREVAVADHELLAELLAELEEPVTS